MFPSQVEAVNKPQEAGTATFRKKSSSLTLSLALSKSVTPFVGNLVRQKSRD
jgi:hypothetical protein